MVFTGTLDDFENRFSVKTVKFSYKNRQIFIKKSHNRWISFQLFPKKFTLFLFNLQSNSTV